MCSEHLGNSLLHYYANVNNFPHKIVPDCVLRLRDCRLKIQGNKPGVKNALLAKPMLNTCLE